MARDCGTVNVVEPTSQEDVTVSNCGVSPQQINPGQEVSVTGTVVNNGTTDAEVEIGLEANGSVVDSMTETIASGQGVDAEFVVTPGSDTSYSITVASVTAV